MQLITRARTCQNCKFGQFKKKDWIGASGRAINGLCMRYADAPMPRQYDASHYLHYAFASDRLSYVGKHPVDLKFKEARRLEDLPAWEEFAKGVAEHWRHRNDASLETVRGWYDGCYAWSAWWIRNWETVAERKIDRTTVCEAWDGTQTSKFYKAPKARKR